MTGLDERSPQVIVRRRGLTMTVRIFGADSFDTLGAQQNKSNPFKFRYYEQTQIVTTPQDFDDRGDVLFGEGEVIPCVSIEERLPTFKIMSKQSSSSFFKTIADVSKPRYLQFNKTFEFCLLAGLVW